MTDTLTTQSSPNQITDYITEAFNAGLDAKLAGRDLLADAHLDRAGKALAFLRALHPAAGAAFDLEQVAAEWEARHG